MRAVLGALVILVVQALGDVLPRSQSSKVDNHVMLQRQIELSGLFDHISEPINDPKLKAISESWDLEQNIEHFNNVSAVNEFLLLQERGLLIPRLMILKPNSPSVQHEFSTVFNLLYGVKDYSAFFKTAVYLKQRLNAETFVYVLSIAIMKHPETQGIIVPPIYEIMPAYFQNAEVMNFAQRINIHGSKFVNYYPETYIWEDNVVIGWNSSVGSHVDAVDSQISYYLNDYALNTLNYNNHIRNPSWLSEDISSLNSNKMGAYNWFFNKQFLARYYLERLSNGLGEIPLLSWDVIEEGYSSGLAHYNGVPLPVRPDYLKLAQPRFFRHVEQLKRYESRIRDAIQIGYLISMSGKKINLRDPEAVGVLMNVVEGNVHSPNSIYYGSILSAWKELLGNSIVSNNVWWKGYLPLGVPSALDFIVTELRDPAFYMIWKRVMNLFTLWQSYLPKYKHEELVLPEVQIQKVEVDKLLTYFDNNYFNVSNALCRKEGESEGRPLSVLVQRPLLNNKVFTVSVKVKSDIHKKVIVRFFLGPKYNSKGLEIPLNLNAENFFQIDQFIYELPVGESVIKRESTSNMYMMDKWWSCSEIVNKAVSALQGNSQFVVDPRNYYSGFPRHIILPRGRVGGMPFQLLVYINEYKASPEPVASYPGGAFYNNNDPWGYPLDRPLDMLQIDKLSNLHIKEVQIYHKPNPEIVTPYNHV